jgi:hypothetical protein
VIGNGRSIQLLYDKWDEKDHRCLYPELFSYAVDKCITLQHAKRFTPTQDLFHLPMSIEAYEQLQKLDGELSRVHISENVTNGGMCGAPRVSHPRRLTS